MLISSPVWATVDGWPALHDVVGVASDDVLNVRAEPNAQAEIIGTLEHDAVAIEVIRPDEDFEWGLINTNERAGWVSLRFLERQPGQWLGQFPAIRHCFGTEPFWALSANNETISLHTPIAGASGSRGEIWQSMNRRDVFAFNFAVTPDAGGNQLGGMAILSHAFCSDGMSDNEYGLRLELLLESAGERRLMSGCCSIAPP